MKAILLEELNQKLSIHETPVPTLEAHEALVKVKAAALNRVRLLNDPRDTHLCFWTGLSQTLTVRQKVYQVRC